jgi:hypothetical protein
VRNADDPTASDLCQSSTESTTFSTADDWQKQQADSIQSAMTKILSEHGSNKHVACVY